MREVKEYTLPLGGKVLDWESFSGDPTNPIRAVGMDEFKRSLTIPASERGFRMSLVEVDVELGTCKVDITAEPSLLVALDTWFGSKSHADIVRNAGTKILKRPKNMPYSVVSPKMNDRRSRQIG